jgi:adenylylsulfate kinase-like enzyme
MIYWFTGQPAHGKSVLAKKLVSDLTKLFGDGNVYHIDGDDIRDLFSNKDYSINGRVANVNAAQKIAHYLHNQGKYVVVSLVSPYIDQREDFKKLIGNGIVEIYVHTTESRERDAFKAIAYIAPQEDYFDIDTTYDNEFQSYSKLKQYIILDNLINKIYEDL